MRKRAQRIPSCPGEIFPDEGRIHLRRPTRHPHFSLATRRRTIQLLRRAYFELVPQELAQSSPYIEHSPTALLLRFSDGEDLQAELVINLDVFEMLNRLNQGYRPTVDELQGYYLILAVFKNILGSAPYQEVLLTTTGHEFYSVIRNEDGHLAMRLSEV